MQNNHKYTKKQVADSKIAREKLNVASPTITPSKKLLNDLISNNEFFYVTQSSLN